MNLQVYPKPRHQNFGAEPRQATQHFAVAFVCAAASVSKHAIVLPKVPPLEDDLKRRKAVATLDKNKGSDVWALICRGYIIIRGTSVSFEGPIFRDHETLVLNRRWFKKGNEP